MYYIILENIYVLYYIQSFSFDKENVMTKIRKKNIIGFYLRNYAKKFIIEQIL